VTRAKKRKPSGYVVALDGPAGAGKSTVSRQLADALEGRLLDTGAMYRAVAYFAIKNQVDTEKEFGVISRGLKFAFNPKTQSLLVNGEDLGLKLRTQKVSNNASHVSKYRQVREALTRKQRSLGRKWSKRYPVIVEGRDIGTVVFPKVDFKFFVTADLKVRAKRRHSELKHHGARIGLKTILKQMEARDLQDSSRKLAPLSIPDDAIVVDTSEMGIHQVVKFMETHIRGHR
jgi:CMP/dCMP kinase